MPVLGRAPSLTIGSNGEITGVISENMPAGQPPFYLNLPVGDGGTKMFYVSRDTRGQEQNKPKAWGAGTRILYTITTCERKPLPTLIPVIAIWSDGEKGPYPISASLIESAVDPSLTFDRTTGKFHLYYWVNGWTPSGNIPYYDNQPDVEEPTLFNSVKPPGPSLEDPLYRIPAAESRHPAPRSFLATRDLPNWFNESVDSSNPYGTIPQPTNEKVGPFNINSFWIAPWTDGHLYRFGPDYDPTPPPAVAPPVPIVPPGTSPPSPPPVIPVEQTDLLNQFSFAVIPQQTIQQEVSIALYRLKKNQPLKPSELATLIEYDLMPRRLANLSRATRVLMHSSGYLYINTKVEEPEVTPSSAGSSLPTPTYTSEDSPQPYLVVDAPQPVYAAPRGINKVMVARNKWTSYLSGESVFITAPMNYRYPSAGTATLTVGNPQVDFTLHDPSDFIDSWKRGVLLPESDTPQYPRQLPEKDLLVPRVFGGTLIDLMSNMSAWQSY